MSASAPWPKRGSGWASSAPSARSARSAPSQAKAPRATIDACALQQRQLALEVGQAVVALGRGRLVGRRRAADDSGDVGVGQAQRRRRGARSRAGWRSPARCSARVEPVAGAVAGEHAAGAVGAVGGGGEADDRQPRRRVAEAGHRAPPVVLAAEAARRVGRACLAPLDQPRAAPAGVDLRGQRSANACVSS